MRRRLIGFILLALLPGVLKPFSVRGQDLQPSPPAKPRSQCAGLSIEQSESAMTAPLKFLP